MAGYCRSSFLCGTRHSHTQTKTVVSILQGVIIRREYTTPFFLQETKGNPTSFPGLLPFKGKSPGNEDEGNPKGKACATCTNETLLKPSCYLLFSRLVFLALVPKIGYDVRMLRWPSLVFCRFPFQEEKRILSQGCRNLFTNS